MSTTILLTCKGCGKLFIKAKKEYNRHIRKGRDHNDFYCNIACLGESRKNPFSGVVKTARKNSNDRKKFDNLGFNLTEDIIRHLWDKQNGRCSYTNIKLEYPDFQNRNKPNTGSLDRIDSSKGYLANNIHWVAYSINLAKRDFSDDDFREFLSEIKLLSH